MYILGQMIEVNNMLNELSFMDIVLIYLEKSYSINILSTYNVSKKSYWSDVSQFSNKHRKIYY